MNEQELKYRFPRASRSFVEINSGLFTDKPKPDIGTALVDKAQGKEKVYEVPSVGIVLYRVRLLDTDNAYASTKTLLDCLCQVGLIVDDSPSDINLSVEQVKVKHKNEQRTVVNILYP